MRPVKILVPVDFSAESRAGLALAGEWARALGAEVTVLHVESATGLFSEAFLASGGVAMGAGGLAQHLEATRRRLATFVSEVLDEKKHPEVRSVVVEAIFVAETIVRFAEEHGMSWICMAATGRRGAQRLLLGSTAEEVVRRSTVPVLTLRAPQRDAGEVLFDDFRRVLLATDLGEDVEGLAGIAMQLAGAKGIVQFLHVIETPPGYGLYGEPLVLPAESLAAAREWTETALRKVAHAFPEERVAEPRIEMGDVAERILHTEGELVPDVTVIGTHGRRGMERFLLGSVAGKVVRHARGPVLVVPTRRKPTA